jgi:RNA polymerase sigma factor (sigma-70 family)
MQPRTPFLDSGMLTNTAILDGLHNPADERAWGLVVGRYRPMLLRFAIRMGLTRTDAEDAAQMVLLELVRSFRSGAYDRTKGRLRQWLFGIARNQVANCKRRRPAEHTPGRDTRTTAFFDRLPGEDRTDAGDTALIDRCLETIRGEVSAQTMDAFHLFAVMGMPAREVASQLGMTENAVFGAKRRVLERVRELMAQTTDA